MYIRAVRVLVCISRFWQVSVVDESIWLRMWAITSFLHLAAFMDSSSMHGGGTGSIAPSSSSSCSTSCSMSTASCVCVGSVGLLCFMSYEDLFKSGTFPNFFEWVGAYVVRVCFILAEIAALDDPKSVLKVSRGKTWLTRYVTFYMDWTHSLWWLWLWEIGFAISCHTTWSSLSACWRMVVVRWNNFKASLTLPSRSRALAIST